MVKELNDYITEFENGEKTKENTAVLSVLNRLRKFLEVTNPAKDSVKSWTPDMRMELELLVSGIEKLQDKFDIDASLMSYINEKKDTRLATLSDMGIEQPTVDGPEDFSDHPLSIQKAESNPETKDNAVQKARVYKYFSDSNLTTVSVPEMTMETVNKFMDILPCSLPPLLDADIDKINELGSGICGVAYTYKFKDLKSELFKKFNEAGICDQEGYFALKLLKPDRAEPKDYIELILEGKKGEVLSAAAKADGYTPENQPCSCSSFTTLNSQPIVAARLVTCGNVISYIADNAEYKGTQHYKNKGEMVINIFNDVLQNIKFMHQNGVLHLDIAARNICIDRDGRAILIDLGLAAISDGIRNDPDTKMVLERTKNCPVRWMPSAALVDREYDSYFDVYSFKVAMLEVLAQTASMHHMDIFKNYDTQQVFDRDDPAMLEAFINEISTFLKAGKYKYEEDGQIVAAIITHFKPFLTIIAGSPLTGSAQIQAMENTFEDCLATYNKAVRETQQYPEAFLYRSTWLKPRKAAQTEVIISQESAVQYAIKLKKVADNLPAGMDSEREVKKDNAPVNFDNHLSTHSQVLGQLRKKSNDHPPAKDEKVKKTTEFWRSINQGKSAEKPPRAFAPIVKQPSKAKDEKVRNARDFWNQANQLAKQSGGINKKR